MLHHSPQLTYIDDYAHHPEEVHAAIDTARKLFPDRQLIVIFQPHLYSRTQDFHAGFAAALSQADVAMLLPIYPAREQAIPGVTSHMIWDQIDLKNKKLIEKDAFIEQLTDAYQPPAVLLSLGAGDIDKLVGPMRDWAAHITS